MINFSKKIAFNEKNVGIGYPAYFVAEIGANFDNSLDKAKLALIRQAKFNSFKLFGFD